MEFLSQGTVPHLISSYGYWAVGGIVAVESMGIPLPGETALITAALIAASTQDLNIWFVILAGSAGAIIGDNFGFLLGRHFGFWLLTKYGRYLRITEPRIKMGQYLFLRYGGAVVFFGRFVAVLRSLAAFLAGTNCMSWTQFVVFNAAGGMVWAFIYGFGAYYLGERASQIGGPAALGMGIVAAVIVVGVTVFVHRHEAELTLRAEEALPGPLARYRTRRN
jgi:membrane protein DedA with SNARE-associated domain